ncbi:hypothetical protein Sste5344_010079 [Sporothrix stenoceras]
MTASRLCLPQAIDDEYLTGAGEPPGEQPPGTIAIIGCYIEAVRLQDIIGQFLAPINHHLESGRASSWCVKGDLNLKTVLEIDRLLDDWRFNLPVHLRIETYQSGQGAELGQRQQRLMLLERQANVLTARYV